MAEPNLGASAKNMRLVCEARERHDAPGGCPFGGRALEAHLHPHDVERLGWEDGDVVCGLRVVASPETQPYTLRVVCDADPEMRGEGEAVVRELAADFEMVPVRASPTRETEGP